MNAFDINTLKDFYAQISAKDGVSVTNFQAELKGLFERPRSDGDLNNYRTSKPPWKKLADEVTPVSRFLRFNSVNSGRIRFPLDNDPPDCWLWRDNESDPVGIEVTIALGRARFHLAEELVNKGEGPGYIGIQDDASKDAFKHTMTRRRVMHSTDQARSAIKDGILRCLGQKNKPKFDGLLLLIQAPLFSLPRERWDAIRSDLCSAAATLPFAEVHVIGNADEAPWGFQIK